MKHKEQFRIAHPETVGETDSHFDLSNYADWLDNEYDEAVRQRDELKEKYSKILEATSELLKSMKTDNVELKKSIAEMRINMAKEIAAIKNTKDETDTIQR